MTIGPEPSTSILCRSFLRGTIELRPEVVEQPERVVRPRASLRVVLDAGRRDVEQPEPLDGAVIEVHVRELGGAEVGLDLPPDLPGDREAVVLRRDRDPPRREVLDRVVRAAVAERELERVEPGRTGQQLMAEADPE